MIALLSTSVFAAVAPAASALCSCEIVASPVGVAYGAGEWGEPCAEIYDGYRPSEQNAVLQVCAGKGFVNEAERDCVVFTNSRGTKQCYR